MHTQEQRQKRASVLASLDEPGLVNMEIPRPDGRVITTQLNHLDALAIGQRLVLQAKIAELYQDGLKLRGGK